MTRSTPSSAPTPWFHNYAPLPGCHDEFVLADGAVRPCLQPMVQSLSGLGELEFQRRWEQMRETIRENGFAYAGYDKARPWDLDAVPLLMPSAEWRTIAAGLAQRARVLNLALRDLFGRQSLLIDGVLPPGVLFQHPGFLRAYQSQPRENLIQLYAADLNRTADGGWQVLNDRTESPSGLGFALENRIIISRMLPEAFQQSRVKRLAPFFIELKELLWSLAPSHRENPHVALLSQGPDSPNYFEDAYLARYLGYTLVEGGDLAVRGRRMMLKTLEGLQPVDVILRRQNSEACDPLQLNSAGNAGVAGLMQALRAGNVGIANGLGSGLVESPVLLAYMPQLCSALLGEPLLLPNVPTWWCGDPDAMEHVLRNLDSLTVRPAYRTRGSGQAAQQQINQLSRDELAAEIRARPHRYIGQQRVARSTAPIWSTTPAPHLQPGYVAIRGQVVIRGDRYTVMEGGLARISATPDALDVSLQKGEGSKDIWVLADGPVEHVSLLEHPGAAVQLRRVGAELPSRSADNIFWLGRQLVRAETLSRLLRSAASRMGGETRSTSGLEVPLLLRCLADQGQIETSYGVAEMRGPMRDIEQELPDAVFDAANPNSLRSVLAEIYRLGTTVRDRMSQDSWRIIRRLDERFQTHARSSTSLHELLAVSNELLIELAAFSGISFDSMTRTHAFRFLDLGRRLERCWQIISLLKNCLVPMPESHSPALETVLEVADSLMTYRSRYYARLQLAPVLDLLLTDESNPRALAFQFARLEELINELPRPASHAGFTRDQRIAMSLIYSARQLDVQSLAETHNLGDEQPLADQFEAWEQVLPQLYEAISHRYLVHSMAAHQLSDIGPIGPAGPSSQAPLVRPGGPPDRASQGAAKEPRTLDLPPEDEAAP